MKRNRLGFAILETLLILIIVGIIGGTGYYVWNGKQQTDKVLSQTDKISKATPATTNNQLTSNRYMNIKEWGVRVPYSGTDTYSYSYDSSNPNSIEIISKTLADKYSCRDSGSGILSRSQGSDYINPFTGGSNETIANYAAGHPGSYIKVGGYYYSLKSENAACSDTSPASAQELAFNTFQRFIKNIQPISQ